MNAGNYDLSMSCLLVNRDLALHFCDWQTPASSPGIRHNTVTAETFAAVLNAQIGSCPTFELINLQRRYLLVLTKVTELKGAELRLTCQQFVDKTVLGIVAGDHEPGRINVREACEFVVFELGVTPRDHDSGLIVESQCFSDLPPRLTAGFGGDSASVDDYKVRLFKV